MTSYWKGRTVFVTGGTGFIGAALVRRLLGEGAILHLLVRRDDLGSLSNLGASLRTHRGDLADGESLRLALREAKPEVVFHLATLRTPGMPDAGEADRRATHALADALQKQKPRAERWIRIALPDTGAEKELGPGLAKRCAVPATCLRVEAVFGPGVRGGPPDPRSESIYIDDMVEALMRAGSKPGAKGAAIALLVGQRSLLGWAPKVTLEEGLRRWASLGGPVKETLPGRPLLSKAAGLYASRGKLLESRGAFQEAVLDFSRAVELEPSRAEYWARRGFLHLCQRMYAQATHDLDKAVALAPDEPEYRDWRARLAFTQFRLQDSADDLAEIARRGAESLDGAVRRGQILALQGRTREALAAAAALGKRQGCAAWGGLLAGYAQLRARDLAAAIYSFRGAISDATAEQSEPREKARFYLTLAMALKGSAEGKMKTMAKSGKKPAKAGRLYLCGMGIRVPHHISMELLQTLQECDVLFCNLAGDDVLEFLALFCKDIRPIAFKDENDLRRCTETLLAEVERGSTVGFMTFGHALVFGPLADAVLKESRKRELECKVLPSISSLDYYLAERGQALGQAFQGFQVYLWSELLRPGFIVNPSLPAIVFFGNFIREAQVAELTRVLTAAYPPGHDCCVFGGRADNGLSENFPLSDLPSHLSAFDIRRQIFIPPA